MKPGDMYKTPKGGLELFQETGVGLSQWIPPNILVTILGEPTATWVPVMVDGVVGLVNWYRLARLG